MWLSMASRRIVAVRTAAVARLSPASRLLSAAAAPPAPPVRRRPAGVEEEGDPATPPPPHGSSKQSMDDLVRSAIQKVMIQQQQQQQQQQKSQAPDATAPATSTTTASSRQQEDLVKARQSLERLLEEARLCVGDVAEAQKMLVDRSSSENDAAAESSREDTDGQKLAANFWEEVETSEIALEAAAAAYVDLLDLLQAATPTTDDNLVYKTVREEAAAKIKQLRHDLEALQKEQGVPLPTTADDDDEKEKDSSEKDDR